MGRQIVNRFAVFSHAPHQSECHAPHTIGKVYEKTMTSQSADVNIFLGRQRKEERGRRRRRREEGRGEEGKEQGLSVVSIGA